MNMGARRQIRSQNSAVRKTATHSDLGMTTKYGRGDAEAIADTMQKRGAHRNKTGAA